MGDVTPLVGWSGPDGPATRVADARDAGRLPDWAGRHADTGARDALVEQFAGTKDIAGAAEALCAEGLIAYDQSEARDLHLLVEAAGLPTGIDAERLRDLEAAEAAEAAGEASPAEEGGGMPMHPYVGLIADSYLAHAEGDAWRYATRGNCYDFVHFAAQIAASEGAPRHSGNTIRHAIDPSTVQEWDHSSPIPRGKVIIGCVAGALGGQGSDGTYHFAVSLGDGMVANNRKEGVRRERLHDVFGGWFTFYRLPRGRVLYGDYACYAAKPDGFVAGGTVEGTPRNPRSAAEMRTRIVTAGAAVVALLVGALVLGVALVGGAAPDERAEEPASQPAAPEDVPVASEPEPTDAPEPEPAIPDVLVRHDPDRGVFVVAVVPEGEFALVDPLEARGGPQAWQVVQGFVNDGEAWAVVYHAPGPECPPVNGEIDVLEADGSHGFGVQFAWGAPLETPRHYLDPIRLPHWQDVTVVDGPCVWGALVPTPHLAGVDEMHAWVSPAADNTAAAVFTEPVSLDPPGPVLATDRVFVGGPSDLDVFAELGAFFADAGYEIAEAPATFFYAHAFDESSWPEPFTHTGQPEGID